LNSKPIEIYTDGSCHTQKRSGAWASILLIDNEEIVLKGEETNTTHNCMELLAVIHAIAFVEEKQITVPLVVYTDSQYVSHIHERKEKLKNNKFCTNKGTPIQNADLVQTLIQQVESHSIGFIKVKAHQRTGTIFSIYNSKVDKLCRRMVRESANRNTV